MKEKENYLLSLRTKSFLNSSNSVEFSQELNFPLIEDIEAIININKEAYYREILKTTSDDIYIEINEYDSLLSAIPKDSIETIKIANENISKIYTNFQEEKLYDAENFYEIYFNLNNQNQAELQKQGLRVFFSNMNFESWFSSSQVMDELKNPLEVYHGTGANEFTRFNFDNFPIAYFAENLSYSRWFQKARGGEGVMFKCFLRIQNPIDLSLFGVKKVSYDEFVSYIKLKYGYDLPINTMLKKSSEVKNGMWAWQYIRGGVEWLNLIKNDGYFDGIKYYENNPDNLDAQGNESVTPAWAVFNANQIKSRYGNVTFSYDSEDIRFEKGGNTKTETK